MLLGCKPYQLGTLLGEPGMREALRDKLLISILAGITVPRIEETIYGLRRPLEAPSKDAWCRVVRVMPNTAALVRESDCDSNVGPSAPLR